jgi:class 3 adenylate cyclase/tetratricopeptide (TPR) repeat protein
MGDREQLELAIAAQEQLRGVVPDDVIDLTVASLREKLAAAAVPQRRRHATVLFADVRGFTSLAETADAEIVVEIMNAVWGRIDAVIEAAGGRIDKHIGDAVMAIWGADVSSEDDPERAVRAALDLQAALALDGEAFARGLEMRVGIATGPVVLGEVATTREFTAMGDTVNVAARLEGAAPVGGVLISHDTYRHVRGVFDVRPQGPLQVRGRTEAVRAYVVLRAKQQSFRIPSRGVEGVETRMVGRDAELGSLQRAFESVIAGAGAATVTIVGEAGVGKSRLLYEFENWVELLPEGVFYLRARALASRQAVPYGVIRDLLASRFEIVESDERADVTAKLRRGFAPHLTADEADVVGHWLGFDAVRSAAIERLRSAQGYSNVCAGHLALYLRSIAASGPALIVLEDLHWADEESLELVEHIAHWLQDERLCLVGATRPALLERHPDWLTRSAGSRHVLHPLSHDSSRALVDDVLQLVPAVPSEIADLVVERAEGNPFFVEELIKMLIDDGVIVPADAGEPWQVDLARLDAASVPATLTGVLEARLDSLTRDQRDALQRASVVGRVFWDAAVCALAAERPEAETHRALDVARSRELVFRSERPSLDVSVEYVFKHALLRDVTYETVLLRDRTRLHGLVADWLEANAGERLGELLELVAEHRLLAGDGVAAAEGFSAAAQRARAAGRSPSAVRLGRLALELWSQHGVEPPAGAVVGYAESCCRTGAIEAAWAALSPLSGRDLPPEEEAEALYVASWAASERGEREQEHALLERALPLAEMVGGTVLIHVLLGRGFLAAGDGDLEAVERDAARALAIAEEDGNLVDGGRAWGLLAQVHTLRHNHVESLACAGRALELSRSAGDLEGEAIALGNLGVVRHLLADDSGDAVGYELAIENYRAQLALDDRLGKPHTAAMATLNIAQASLRLGRQEEAVACLAQARATGALAESVTLQFFAAIVEAELAMERGDIEEGLERLAGVQRHPAVRDFDRQEIVRVLTRAGLTADALDAVDNARPPSDGRSDDVRSPR